MGSLIEGGRDSSAKNERQISGREQIADNGYLSITAPAESPAN
jgi:hypothetical protein